MATGKRARDSSTPAKGINDAPVGAGQKDHAEGDVGHHDEPLAEIHVSPLRSPVWNRLVQTKFNAIYMCDLARQSRKFGNLYSGFLAIVSTYGVTTWAIWQQHQTTWAITVGSAQILQIAKPFLPFLKSDKDYLAMSFEFEDLYLEYVSLFTEIESGSLGETEILKRFTALKKKENDIAKKHKDVLCPRVRRWMNRSADEQNRALGLDFPGVIYEE
jgi:hypothetical protein